MNLFQIEQQYIELADKLIELEGELTPEIEQALNITLAEFETKSIAYGHVIRKLDAECDIIDAEIKRLQSIKRSRESALERLKMRIKDAMELFGMDKVQTPTLKLSFRKSESVEVEDVNALPSMYKTIKVTESPDKQLIKESLKLGKEIPGARLVTNNNLQIK